MSLFKAPSTPYVPPPAPPPPPPNSPQFGSELQKAAGNRYQAGQGGGVGSTILTSGQGLLTPASTAKKTLLGQ